MRKCTIRHIVYHDGTREKAFRKNPSRTIAAINRKLESGKIAAMLGEPRNIFVNAFHFALPLCRNTFGCCERARSERLLAADNARG